MASAVFNAVVKVLLLKKRVYRVGYVCGSLTIKSLESTTCLVWTLHVQFISSDCGICGKFNE